MKQLKYYILGIVSFVFVLPLLNKLLELAELWLESLKVKPQKRILEGNKDTAIIREFLKPTQPVYDYDDEDFDEDEE